MKCGQDLVANTKLGIMECVSGLHIEAINLNLPQWWYQCPNCSVMGTNYESQERFTQKFDENNKPVFLNQSIVFEEKTPDPITCKACGFTFNK